MNVFNSHSGLQLPFMDAILDDEPELPAESFVNLARKLREYRQSVVRDIERLLNTKSNQMCACTKIDGDTLYCYGVEDFTHINVASLHGQEMLRKKIMDVIRENEPRLSHIDVFVRESIESDNRLNFRIEGRLKVYADSDLLILNATFEPANKAFTLKHSGR